MKWRKIRNGMHTVVACRPLLLSPSKTSLPSQCTRGFWSQFSPLPMMQCSLLTLTDPPCLSHYLHTGPIQIHISTSLTTIFSNNKYCIFLGPKMYVSYYLLKISHHQIIIFFLILFKFHLNIPNLLLILSNPLFPSPSTIIWGKKNIILYLLCAIPAIAHGWRKL